jgi:hypothetical protein
VSADDLRRRYPHIEWDRPIKVEVLGGPTRMCCRICIAEQGIRGHEVADRGFDTFEDFQDHLERVHAA